MRAQITPVYNYSPQMWDETPLQLITMLPAGKKRFHVWKFHSYFVFKKDKGNNIVVQCKLCMKTHALTKAT